MKTGETPTITSFVIRFVQDAPLANRGGSALRGTIHHVQSNQEIPFTRWEDAVEFIQRFVPILISPASTSSSIEGENDS